MSTVPDPVPFEPEGTKLSTVFRAAKKSVWYAYLVAVGCLPLFFFLGLYGIGVQLFIFGGAVVGIGFNMALGSGPLAVAASVALLVGLYVVVVSRMEQEFNNAVDLAILGAAVLLAACISAVITAFADPPYLHRPLAEGEVSTDSMIALLVVGVIVMFAQFILAVIVERRRERRSKAATGGDAACYPGVRGLMRVCVIMVDKWLNSTEKTASEEPDKNKFSQVQRVGRVLLLLLTLLGALIGLIEESWAGALCGAIIGLVFGFLARWIILCLAALMTPLPPSATTTAAEGIFRFANRLASVLGIVVSLILMHEAYWAVNLMSITANESGGETIKRWSKSREVLRETLNNQRPYIAATSAAPARWLLTADAKRINAVTLRFIDLLDGKTPSRELPAEWDRVIVDKALVALIQSETPIVELVTTPLIEALGGAIKEETTRQAEACQQRFLYHQIFTWCHDRYEKRTGLRLQGLK